MGITDHQQAILDFNPDFRADNSVIWSITVTGMVPATFVQIPLVGTIPAGYPSDQEQQSDRCVSIDEDTLQLPKNARTFALEVRGDSMIDAHIVEGDVVIWSSVIRHIGTSSPLLLTEKRRLSGF